MSDTTATPEPTPEGDQPEPDESNTDSGENASRPAVKIEGTFEGSTEQVPGTEPGQVPEAPQPDSTPERPQEPDTGDNPAPEPNTPQEGS